MSELSDREEYDEVHRLLARVAPQYPSLTLDELHAIFDEVYERETAALSAINGDDPKTK